MVAVAGRRAGPPVAARPKSLVPSTGAASPSSSPVAPESSAQPSQWVKVPAGASGSMVQTRQAWDWGVELRDEERSELELLHGTVAQLRGQLEQAHDSLRVSRQREQDARQELRQLDQTGPWRRRRVRTALRNRQLL